METTVVIYSITNGWIVENGEEKMFYASWEEAVLNALYTVHNKNVIVTFTTEK